MKPKFKIGDKLKSYVILSWINCGGCTVKQDIIFIVDSIKQGHFSNVVYYFDESGRFFAEDDCVKSNENITNITKENEPSTEAKIAERFDIKPPKNGSVGGVFVKNLPKEGFKYKIKDRDLRG